MRGDNHAVELLSQFFPEDTMEYIRKIKPTNWNEWKTEAIDFSQPFLWFDDDLFQEEKDDLLAHGVLENWIEVDLSKDEDRLKKFLSSFPMPINGINN
jgi:hypothetical protein